jgi:hypothetical protein
MNTIKNILYNNEHNTYLVGKHPPPQKQKTHTDPQHYKTKWVTYNYSGEEVRRCINFFKTHE